MDSKKLLIVFAKNPILGKVKTRLAETVGDERALEIYIDLLEHTRNVASNADCEVAIFYSDFIDDGDEWKEIFFQKYVQEGVGLGNKMHNAIELGFRKGYDEVVIIGSDCYQLTPALVNEAFHVLSSKDVVIGPAKDGGYYLLGMKSLHQPFFENKTWSSENVFLDTLLDINKLKLSYQLLDTLSDVDYVEDLEQLTI